MTAHKTFSMVRPCERCPFRTDLAGGPYLHPARAAEIKRDLHGDKCDFYCHEGVDYDALGDEWYEGDQEHMLSSMSNPICAGAMIILMREGMQTQLMRIEMGIRRQNLDEVLDMAAPVHDSMQEFVEAMPGYDAWIEEQEERQCCEVCDMNCEAPAGYLINGEVEDGEGNCDTQCSECWEFCCPSCSAGDDEEVIICPSCHEREAA